MKSYKMESYKMESYKMESYKMESYKMNISKLFLLAPVVILLGFDIFYRPDANDNLELIGYPLMLVLMLLAFTLFFL